MLPLEIAGGMMSTRYLKMALNHQQQNSQLFARVIAVARVSLHELNADATFGSKPLHKYAPAFEPHVFDCANTRMSKKTSNHYL